MKKYILWILFISVLSLCACDNSQRAESLDDAVSFCVWNNWILTTSWDFFVCTFEDWSYCEWLNFTNENCKISNSEQIENTNDIENNTITENGSWQEVLNNENEKTNQDSDNDKKEPVVSVSKNNRNDDVNSNKNLENEQNLGKETITCTADVKKCPDWSYVSRQAPDCEFKECPKIEQAPKTDGVSNNIQDTKATESENQQWFTDIIHRISDHSENANSEETADLEMDIIDYIKNMD